MPASWKLYSAKRLKKALRFPARPKPHLSLHEYSYTLFIFGPLFLSPPRNFSNFVL